MSTVDELKNTISADASNLPVAAAHHQAAPDYSDGQWINVAEPLPGAKAASFDYTLVLHALRRHWLLAAVVGLVFATVAGFITYYWMGARYESFAYLKVSGQDKSFLGSNNVQGAVEFEIYKNTQKQMMKNPQVLTAALDKKEVKSFNIDKIESDPVGWLAGKLQITFPDKAEIMVVSLVSKDSKQAQALVNSVVDSYLDKFVGADKKTRADRLDALDRIYEESTREVRDARTELRRLADQFGTSDEKGISLKQQIGQQQFAEYQRQHMTVKFQLEHANAELNAINAQIQHIKDMEISRIELDRFTRDDPMMRNLIEDLYYRKQDAERNLFMTSAKQNSPILKQQQEELKQLQRQFDERIDEVRAGVRTMKLQEIEKDQAKAAAEVASLTQQERDLAQEEDLKRIEAVKLSSSSVEMRMLQAKIDQLDDMLKKIGDERDKLRVEQRAESRVTLIRGASEPKTETGVALRFLSSALASLVAFCLPVGLIVVWDLRGRKVNSSKQVSRELGLPVMGSVPVIPARAVRRLSSQSAGSRNWQLRLTESIDGIAARFHRRSALDGTRVILVTSASGGEGKTTIATQLALSFARNGRRTALVDFDLRRPALDAVFGLSEETGISDVLRGDEELAARIHPTATDNLSVVTAGKWDRQALASLANGGAGRIIEELRKQYDFVVIDSSPILPVADTRFVSQHVDAVVLSVFRDVSQAPKVQAAGEILEAFGVQTIEVVITGSSDGQSDKDMGYQSRMSA
jgi:polysaccharide biosynthesis transport protein